MIKPIVIGLHGAAESGKDEVAKGLTRKGEDPLIKTYAFADKLKEFAYACNPLIKLEHNPIVRGVSLKFEALHLRTLDGTLRLQEIVDALGWDDAKKIPDVRSFLQKVGTEGGQKVFGQRFWANLVKQQVDVNVMANPNFVHVIKDLRHPHEFDTFMELDYIDFFVIKIERRSHESALTEENKRHSSETFSLPYNICIQNNVDLEMLHGFARAALYMFRTEPKPEFKN